MLSIGANVDRYVVEEILGEGGTAIVYKVRHAELGTTHALKVLTIAKQDLVQRTLEEGRIQARLRHPNVVAVTDVIRIGMFPALVLEYIDGPTLHDLLDHFRPTTAQVDAIAIGMMEGVASAHAKNFVHRDLKPANVMLSLDPHVVAKVTDFGLARVTADDTPGRTRPGIAFGTPQFMAPEQFRSARDVDGRADVFSLGAVLYELVTGASAFGYDDPVMVFDHVRAENYRPPNHFVPDIPQRMADAIAGALRSDRDKRIPSVAELLKVWRGGEAIDPILAWADVDRALLRSFSPRKGPPERTRSWSPPDRAGAVEADRGPVSISPPTPPSPVAATTPIPKSTRTSAISDLGFTPRRAINPLPLLIGVGALAAVGLCGGAAVMGGSAVVASLAGPPPADPPVAVVEPVPMPPVAPPEAASPPDAVATAPAVVEPVVGAAESTDLAAPPATPVSKPVAKPVTKPVTRPAAPPESAPVTTPPATAAVNTGPRVYLSGVESAFLVGSDGARHRPGELLVPGTYTLSVFFDPEKATDAMQVEVVSDPISVKCYPDMKLCKAAK